MLIRRLILQDYGLYCGRHEFDLVPRVRRGRKRPIVLFGGKNGAGKTTILEAVQLALYGKTALGPRVRQVDYEAHLRSRVHRARSPLFQAKGALIGIEFDYVLRGQRQTYYVERSWSLTNGNGVNTALAVMRRQANAQDYLPLDEVESEFWQAFVRDIVPEGLSQLFFFDGEKIKQIAEDETGDIALADSIKSLLGLDLVERLDADLAIYASRQAAKAEASDYMNRLEEVERHIASIEAEIERLDETLGGLQKEIDQKQGEARRSEEDLRREGQDFATHRDHAVSTHALLTAEIEALERQIREECEGLFPLALCPTAARLLQAQIASERDATRRAYLASELQLFRNDLVARLQRAELGVDRKASTTVRRAVTSVVDNVLEAYTEPEAAEGAGSRIHELSDTDAQRFLGWLDTAAQTSVPTIRKLCRQLETANRKLREAERQLARIPEADAIQPIVERLGELRQELGALKQSQDERQEQLTRARNELAALQRQRDRIVAEFRGRKDHERRIQKIQETRTALAEYLRRLTEMKINQLREAVAACFNLLCRKGDMLRRIEIDARTFRVTLFDAYGNELPKVELSSGEKQIYAVAMLWGLAKTSGRPLPVIIDTPLGRLDSDHRRHLVEHYFPHASHQVIMLSTDTEIDLPLFQALDTHISHVYHLQFEQSSGSSVASEEYFWKEKVHA